MPRKKVPLAERKRALIACHWCKVHKKRCDGGVPCSNCARRDNAESCSYSEDVAKGDTPGGWSRQSDSRSPKRATRSNQVPPKASIGEEKPPSGALHRTKPRMLSNAQGEKVYVGRSASIAFLQLVRDTVTQYIGTTDFSQHSARDHMLEGRNNLAGDVDLQDFIILEPRHRQDYVNQYSIASSGILQIFNDEELFYMACIDTQDLEPYYFAIGRLVLAIGAQCSNGDPVHRRHELQLFEGGRQAAMSCLLENPSLEFVTSFLLMSFFMLGACRRNAAYMYLGVAVRAAYALGVHSVESTKQVPIMDKQRRSRIWQSLVTIDEMISSILDRPSAISLQHIKEGPLSMESDSAVPCNTFAFGAAFRLSIIVADIGEKLQEKGPSSLVAAERQLRDLRQWTEDLPQSLKNHAKGKNQCVEAQRSVVGSLHVSCYYYFAVILVTRPFLIAHLSERHAADLAYSVDQVTSDTTHGELRMADMAYACLRAAIGMSQACSEVIESAGLFENMRMLKAWIFAAGLVIGFQMFAEPAMDLELEEAYKSVHGVLNILANNSIQAAHYFDILSCLSSAIKCRRQSLAAKTKRPSELVSDRLISFHQSGTPDGQASTLDNRSGLLTESSSKRGDISQNLPNLVDNGHEGLQLEMDDSMWIWENAASQIWEQSPDIMFPAVE